MNDTPLRRGNFMKTLRNLNRLILAIVVRTLWKRKFQSVSFHFFGWRSLNVRQLERIGPNYVQLSKSSRGLAAWFRQWPAKDEPFSIEVTLPVGMWNLSNVGVVLNPKFSSVSRGSELLIEPRVEKGPYHFYPSGDPLSGQFVYLQAGDRVLVKNSTRSKSLSSAVYCGTRAAHNWGHWLLNFMPAVMLAGEYFGKQDSPPLIVAPDNLSTESRRFLFHHFWGDRPTVTVERSQEVCAQELHWFEQPVADSPRAVNARSLLPKAVNYEILTRFRGEIQKACGVSDKKTRPERKLFLAREVGRRHYNSNELHTIAEDQGFEVVYLNRLSLPEQVRIVSEARVMIGHMGSAFASILFSHPDSKSLILARPNEGEHWWAPFSLIAGSSLHVAYRSGYRGNPWAIEPNDFSRLIASFTS